MKHTIVKFLSITSAILLGVSAFAEAEWNWTPLTPDNSDSQWRFYIGMIVSIDGSVDETFRAFYKATGQDYKQSLAESYDLGDFGVNGPYTALGCHYDHTWQSWSFKWDMFFFDINSDTVAKRDYYIGVGDKIGYNGRSYDHLKIPKGDEFSIALFGAMSDVMFSYAPITFYYTDSFSRLTPSLDLGLVLFGGSFDVDDGAPRGSTVYQNPPVDFVIGGDSSTFIGGGAPKIGLGLTYAVELEDDMEWVSHIDLGYFSYEGSTKFLSGNGDRAKDLDISMLSLNAESGFDIPISEDVVVSLGLRIQFLRISGDVRSKETDTEKIIAARERFDKSVDFNMTTVMGYIGLTY